MKYIYKILLASLVGIVSLSSTFAAVSQTIRYNFRAASEPTIPWYEDVFHPTDDASLAEVIVTSWWRSLVTNPLWWVPVFWVTALANNWQLGSDTWFIQQPFAEYHLYSNFLYWVPLFPDTESEFYLTWLFFPSYQSIWNSIFDTWVLQSNWFTDTAFNPLSPPPSNILLTWLNPSKVYTFKIAWSLDDASFWFLTWSTTYAVQNLSNNAILNTRWNTSHYVTFAWIMPNAQWEIPLRAYASRNPDWFIWLLWWIEIIESEVIDVPVIDFGTWEFRIYTPNNTINLSPTVTVSWGASLVSYNWKQLQWPQQASIVTPFANTAQIIGLNKIGVYIFELAAKADNGIEQRAKIRVVVDSGNWKEELVPNTDPSINDWLDIEYLEYLPNEYNNTWCENKKYPAIIYLHWYSQNWRDTEMLKWEGLGYLVDSGVTNLQFTGASWELENFIALMPQLSTSTVWDVDDIDTFMSHITNAANYRIDYNRIYIVWYSFWSLWLWNYLASPWKADIFAAAVPTAYVPTRWPSYCNSSWTQIYALSEADMVAWWYYISSPTDFTNFMNNLALCPINPAAIWQIITWRSHVEMYNFYWQLDYTWFEGKNIFEWFLDHERNYASGWAWDSCFVPNPIIDFSVSPSIQTILSGDNSSFNVTLLNTWNIALTWLQISSSVPGCSATFDYLDVWATTWYSCSVSNVTTWFTQFFTVTWYAYSWWISYSWYATTDTWSALVNVNVLAPSILITQTPVSQNVVSGSNVMFTITVTNTGNVALSWVMVSNPTLASCDNTIWLLWIWASSFYNCSATNVIADFITTSYVTWYAYTWWITYMSNLTAANAISNITVVQYVPQLSFQVTPSNQTINAWDTASFSVIVGNSWAVDMTWIIIDVPQVSWCSVYIWWLTQWSTTWYTCQQTNVLSTFSPQFTTSWYATSWWVDYPSNTNTQNQTVTVTVNPIAPPPPLPSAQLSLQVTPSTQTINEWDTASFTVVIWNSWMVDLTRITIDVPQVPWCSVYVWWLTQWSVAWYSCQQTNVLSSFSPQFVTSWYATSGWIDYSTNTDIQNQTLTVIVNPIVPPPPPPPSWWWSFGWFAGWWWSTTSIPSLSSLWSSSSINTSPTISQTITTSNNNNNNANINPWNNSTVVVQIPNDTALPSAPLVSNWGWSSQSNSTYDSTTNGSDAYALEFASLRQLISWLLKM